MSDQRLIELPKCKLSQDSEEVSQEAKGTPLIVCPKGKESLVSISRAQSAT